ncbi:MAG: PaaI family thioesterase [Gammaproteobacteria bacterium]
MAEREIFQDYMPGAVCFGCGENNPAGLKIQSFWEGDEGVCLWQPDERHQGWEGITCGGIIATLIDCHCMATAMATAVRNENRPLSSEPRYRFATGSLNIRFLKPTPIVQPLLLRAHVTEIKDARKYTLACDLYADNVNTVAAAVVVGVLVYRSDRPWEGPGGFKG